MKIVMSHPTGNRNVRAVMESLSSAGMLAEFNTTVATDPGAAWLNLLPGGVRHELLRRSFSIDPGMIKTHPMREIARMVFPRVGLKMLTNGEKAYASIDSVYHNLDNATASRLPYLKRKGAVDAVYAYEDGALATFTQAKKLGLKCIYDLPIAYWETVKKLMKEEAERLPQWAVTLGGGIKDSAAKLEIKTRELELADVVVGPCNFVMDSLPEWSKNKQIIRSPFGSPEGNYDSAENNKDDKSRLNRPLRVLFAGSMGQRKGLGDLFNAIKKLNTAHVELVVMGSMLAPADFYRGQLQNFTYESGRPHKMVLELMRSCDVFCLPSIVEGRALVMQEAMSQGLPLIITPNTGGDDLIIEGVTGFLVPTQSPEAIAEKISWFLDNRKAIPVMGRMAKEKAKEYTWAGYGDKIVRSLIGSVD